MLSSLIFFQMYLPTRVYLLFDLLHGLFIKIRPMTVLAFIVTR